MVINNNPDHPVAELVLDAGYEVVDLFYYMQAQGARYALYSLGTW